MGISEDQDNASSGLDPALVRGLTEPRYTRAQLLKSAGAGAGAIGAGAILAACGVSGTAAKSGGTSAYWAKWWSKQKQTGTLDFANWPLYIDTSHGKHPSLAQFTKATGINVNYFEVIQDNASFYAKVAPTLQGGQPIGYDIGLLTRHTW